MQRRKGQRAMDIKSITKPEQWDINLYPDYGPDIRWSNGHVYARCYLPDGTITWVELVPLGLPVSKRNAKGQKLPITDQPEVTEVVTNGVVLDETPAATDV